MCEKTKKLSIKDHFLTENGFTMQSKGKDLVEFYERIIRMSGK